MAAACSLGGARPRDVAMTLGAIPGDVATMLGDGTAAGGTTAPARGGSEDSGASGNRISSFATSGSSSGSAPFDSGRSVTASSPLNGSCSNEPSGGGGWDSSMATGGIGSGSTATSGADGGLLELRVGRSDSGPSSGSASAGARGCGSGTGSISGSGSSSSASGYDSASGAGSASAAGGGTESSGKAG